MAKHSWHLSEIYCQSPDWILSAGKSLLPIPTQKTPAPNHFSKLSLSGETPPVTMILDQGIGAKVLLIRFVLVASPGKIFVKSQPASCAVLISVGVKQPGQ